MAAGGFKEFVAGETLDEDEINDFLMQGMLVFAGTAARGSAITAPVEGQFSFLKDSDAVEFYDGTDWVALSSSIDINFVVVGGGGGGGGIRGGGGGAGGYRSSVSGELSGGSAVAEDPYQLVPGTYQLTVGGGGAALTNGHDSVLGLVVSDGGGAGGEGVLALRGGSGGGGGGAGGPAPAPGRTGQGLAGGTATGNLVNGAGGGGGGAIQIGANAVVSSTGGNGGNGIASSITGTSVTRAGGGGGGKDQNSGTGGTGGTGGGGDGGRGNTPTAGDNGDVNTGGGAGGGGGISGSVNGVGGQGGSGIVIFSVPTGTGVSFSAGVTETNSTVGSNDVYIVTATSTDSETVTFG